MHSRTAEKLIEKCVQLLAKDDDADLLTLNEGQVGFVLHDLV